MNAQDQPPPNSREERNGINSRHRRSIDIATGGIILAGFLAFFGLVAALFYPAMEGTGEENLNLWYKALRYVLSAFAVLSASLVFLRLRLQPSHRSDNDTDSPRFSRIDIAVGGLIISELVALVVLVTALAYMEWLDIEDPDISNWWGLALWCALSGMVALSATLASLRLRLFLTLAWIVATCSFVLVIAVLLLMEARKDGFTGYNPFSLRAIILCLLVVASLAWCLKKARQEPTRSGIVVFGATTFGTVAVMLFAICIWALGDGTHTSGSTEQSAALATPIPPVTWEAVRSIIAEQLHVPEERVTPNARLREDLNAKTDDVVQITGALENKFGIEAEPNDDEVILTAQDAFEFAQSPETFKDQAFRRR